MTPLENGFYLESVSNVRLEDLEIRHYGSGDYGKGVYLRYSADCVVRASRIHEVGSAGVWIKGGDRHRVEDNEIWDTSIFNWPWGFTKGSSAENNAVVLTNDMGRGHVLRRNTIHGQFNGIGPCGASVTAGFTIRPRNARWDVALAGLHEWTRPDFDSPTDLRETRQQVASFGHLLDHCVEPLPQHEFARFEHRLQLLGRHHVQQPAFAAGDVRLPCRIA